MNNLELLLRALNYVEEHLQEELCTEDIANGCYCSKSTLEKLFRHVNHISVRDYIVRRRMTLAAARLAENPEMTVLDVALQYGYGSNEAFTRAFKQVWNCKPSEFREKNRVSELFPRLNVPAENGEEYIMNRHSFDISGLYDLFSQRRDCYFVCSDIVQLVPINNISHKEGDLAILESMQRMEDAAGEEDFVFRIGGDEFVLLTDSADVAYAEQIAEKIRSRNGEEIDFEGKKIPLSLTVSITRQSGVRNVKYDELFSQLHYAIKRSKEEAYANGKPGSQKKADDENG